MKKIDCGHYVDKPVVYQEGTMVIPQGLSLHDSYVVTSEGLPFNHIVLEEGSLADICFFVFPGVTVDIPILVNLIGERANIRLSAVYLCAESEKVNFDIEVIHRVPNCISDQLIVGIAGGSSSVNFSGKIVVAPNAQQTEAYQLNRNIVANKSAKVQTLPQLEIYADDVKCSHGATIGSLNEDEQFYMRSRGIPEKDAKVLQAISFVSPIVNRITDANEKTEVEHLVEEAIKKIL